MHQESQEYTWLLSTSITGNSTSIYWKGELITQPQHQHFAALIDLKTYFSMSYLFPDHEVHSSSFKGTQPLKTVEAIKWTNKARKKTYAISREDMNSICTFLEKKKEKASELSVYPSTYKYLSIWLFAIISEYLMNSSGYFCSLKVFWLTQQAIG